MSNQNLPSGAFFTSIGGKRCTAIPKANGNNGNNRGANRGGANNNNNNNGGRASAAPSRTRARNSSVASFSTTHSPSPPPPAQTTLSTSTTPTPPPPPPPASTETPPVSTPEPPRSTPPTEVPPPALAAPAPAPVSSSASVAPPAAAPAVTSSAASPAQSNPVLAQPVLQQPTPVEEGVNNSGDRAGSGAVASTPLPAVQSSPPAAAPPASAGSPPIASFSVIGGGVATSAVSSSALQAPQPAQSLEADPRDPAATATPQQPRPTSAPAADVTSTPAAPGTPPVPIAAEPTPSSGGGATPAITTIGTARPTDGGATNSGSGTGVGSGAGISNNPPVSAVPANGNDGDGGKMTIAVAGGVIGGVILISLIAFLIWFFRKRQLKKRRSTLLTPLSTGTGPGFPAEKSYVINRGSIGPTPRTEKFKASVAYGLAKFKDRVNSFVSRGNGSSGGVNMNRGNSQFMENTSPTLSRSSSNASRRVRGGGKGWWGGAAAAGVFKRDKKEDSRDPFGNAQEKKAPMTAGNVSAQPDFLTLLGMDDRELQREAQKKRASRNGSASSTDHFLGNLGLSFNNSNGGGDDPFADSNALPHQSAKPAPLKPGGAGGGGSNSDPFSDANQIPAAAATKPSTYVEKVRRSRGSSIGRLDSFYQRESVNSVDSFETRRNKFRSDPFDLERPELLGRSPGSNAGTLGSDGPWFSSTTSGSAIKPPRSVHQRSESFTSKYSSGVSMGDWSDPGPDIGPGSSRQDLPGMLRGESPTQGINSRRSPSNASNGVGKAM
ncbi:uncharacterized protein PpBr36_06681 [Pyricularia pennisetigena]|uniref:uncharacterized protein n=1 Tax=Pyricularia pennisetigena TaxID=1578925 RepID=UPI0011543D61|nr:uncharacterized protein PpBr36_06681 [Pyricularia pennisetigena]TLS23480.1 hypothetical protein PpBr36_06681 [Pyricularia pennisetigena]